AKGVADHSLSPDAYGILVHPDTESVPLTVIPGLEQSLKPQGTALEVQVRRVKVRFPGSPFPWPVIWSGAGDILAPDRETPLIVGRRYALVQSGSRALDADDGSFTPGDYGFTVNS